MDEINKLIREDYHHRINLHREMRVVDYHEQRDRWSEIRGEVMRWCHERFGIPALGIAVNRDEPGFLRPQSQFVNPEVARFIYDPHAAWVSRGWVFWFKHGTAAFEFKMRWRGFDPLAR